MNLSVKIVQLDSCSLVGTPDQRKVPIRPVDQLEPVAVQAPARRLVAGFASRGEPTGLPRFGRWGRFWRPAAAQMTGIRLSVRP